MSGDGCNPSNDHRRVGVGLIALCPPTAHWWQDCFGGVPLWGTGWWAPVHPFPALGERWRRPFRGSTNFTAHWFPSERPAGGGPHRPLCPSPLRPAELSASVQFLGRASAVLQEGPGWPRGQRAVVRALPGALRPRCAQRPEHRCAPRHRAARLPQHSCRGGPSVGAGGGQGGRGPAGETSG